MLTGLITHAALRQLAGAPAFERGEEYFAAGTVGRLRITDDKVEARVAGTSSYRVILEADGGELVWDCSCPRAADGYFCKHCVAVGFAWLAECESDDGGDVPKAKSGRKARSDPWRAIHEYLETQSPATLIDLLTEAAQRDDRTFESLRLKAERTGGSARAIAAFRGAIDRATDIAGFVDWHRAGGFSGDLDALANSLAELLTPDSAAMLVELAEYAIERIENSLEQVDDSDGGAGEVVVGLGDLHHEACRMARPDPAALAVRLFRLQTTLPIGLCSFDPLTYRDVLGDAGMRRYRELLAAEWSTIKPSASAERFEPRRFQITHLMEMLAKADGDTEQLVAIKAHDLSSAHRYLEIAEIWASARRDDQALEWAERGLAAFPQRQDNRLRDFVAAAWLKRGRRDEALQLTWIQFEEAPSLELYKKLHGVAALIGAWPAQRQRALALVDALGERQVGRPGWQPAPAIGRSLRIEIALWEEDLDSAWVAANAGACSQHLLIRLAERLARSRPDDAVALYRRVVPPIIEQTGNRAYEEAARLIRKIGGLMKKQKQAGQFREYVAELRVRYKPKRNFIKLLDGIADAARE